MKSTTMLNNDKSPSHSPTQILEPSRQTMTLDVTEAARQLARFAKRSTISSDGLDWAALDAGEGAQTLIFMPGTLGTIDIYAKQLLTFSASHRVVVLGYPGERDVDRMTNGFFEVLDRLKVESAHFVGSSLGGYWLQVFTREQCHFVKSLVLGNTFVDSRRLHFIRMFQRELLSGSSIAEVKLAWLSFVESLESSELKTFLQHNVRDKQSDIELYGRASTIAYGVLANKSAVHESRIAVISCDDDKVIDKTTTDEVWRMYPDAKHVSFARGGHYPHVLNTVAYNDTIHSFCFGLDNGLPSS